MPVMLKAAERHVHLIVGGFRELAYPEWSIHAGLKVHMGQHMEPMTRNSPRHTVAMLCNSPR